MMTLGALLFLSSMAAQPSWPSLSSDVPRTGGGENDVAVVVGASDYVFLPKIDGAATNADDWAQWLGRVRGIPPDRLTLLRDRDATREKIERALHSAAAAARGGGVLWVIFIGHGAPASGGDDGALLGIDTQAELESLGARGLTQRRLLEIVGAGKQKDSVLVFDACFSGRAPDGGAPLVPGMQATVPVRKGAPRRAIVLSASDTFAGPLPGTGRPAFSYALLGALRGWGDEDGDRQVTLGEAFRWTRGTLQAAFKSAGRLPQMTGSGDLVVAKNVGERAPDVNALVLGKCPSGTAWDGRACGALASAVAPNGSGALAAFQEAVRAGVAKHEAATTAEQKLAAAATLERALGMYPMVKGQGDAEELAAHAELRIAAVEADRLTAYAVTSDDLETQKAQLRRLDEEMRVVLGRLARIANDYGHNAMVVPALATAGRLCELAQQLYQANPCPKQVEPRRCQEYLAATHKASGDNLVAWAIKYYRAAVERAALYHQTGPAADLAAERLRALTSGR